MEHFLLDSLAANRLYYLRKSKEFHEDELNQPKESGKLPQHGKGKTNKNLHSIVVGDKGLVSMTGVAKCNATLPSSLDIVRFMSRMRMHGFALLLETPLLKFISDITTAKPDKDPEK